MTGVLVLKVGGELIESAADRARIAACCAAIVRTRPLVVVHGGGRAIDAELGRRGIAPTKVDGLRVTDAATLDVVVSVLAGASNTELVAALVAADVPAVGLTGVDAGCARATRSSGHLTASGAVADLGFVGDPTTVDPALFTLLTGRGYVPVVASVGLGGQVLNLDVRPGSEPGGRQDSRPDPQAPQILNVNADVMACRIAAAIGAEELVIAGATAGVLDRSGQTIATLDLEGIGEIIADGTATAGMIAKLSSCREAIAGGVAHVRIIDGRGLSAGQDVHRAPGTTLVSAAMTAGQGLR